SIGIMGAATDMSGAIIAQSTLVVESDLKKVQHPSGGVVKQLLVHEGARVGKDDVLLLMDETGAQANLSAVTNTLWGLEDRRARLQAEREGAAEIAFPEQLLAETESSAQSIISGEKRYFQLRHDASDGQKRQFKEQIAQLQEEIGGMQDQLSAKKQES